MVTGQKQSSKDSGDHSLALREQRITARENALAKREAELKKLTNDLISERKELVKQQKKETARLVNESDHYQPSSHENQFYDRIAAMEIRISALERNCG